MAISPDGQIAAFGGFNGSVCIWNLGKGNNNSSAESNHKTITAL